jgi:gliding motility-associated-like protein
MKKIFLPFVLICCVAWAFAQPTPPVTDGLIAYYSFDNCDATDDTGNGSDGILVGAPGCVCGVSGNALEMDGLDDYILFLGLVNNYFDTDNFTVSFYFKSFGSPLPQDILSKREDCGIDQVMSISYTPSFNSVNCFLSEDGTKSTSSTGMLDFSNCWHHVVLVRKGGKATLWLDGVLVQESSAISRVDLENNAILSLADSPCIGTNLNRFKGYIDELAVYSRELLDDEVESLYLNPDNVINNDTLVYLGGSVDVFASNTCATSFSWTPTDGVDDPTSPKTTITPTETTTYQLSFLDENGCQATDTVLFRVVDPATLDCELVFVPKAFTPNGKGPLANETIGISNPYAIEELISFEIFDRWGGRVFHTDNAFDQWNGEFSGQPVNPGVFLYKMTYLCQGEETSKFGSLSLIR